MNLDIKPARRLRGELHVPGDKSITHRSLLLSALSDGTSRLSNLLGGGDCAATWRCVEALGVEIEPLSAHQALVHGRGMSWREPRDVLDCGGSGTTMRLLAGLLAGQRFASVLGGNAQLRNRPMDRVMTPLRLMGASIEGEGGGRLAPLYIQKAKLHGIHYQLPMASAQVKSCVLLAGLLADGETMVSEPALSRDHTERMLAARGVAVGGEAPKRFVVGPVEHLVSVDTTIPGDFSSAAYLIVGGLLVPDSKVLIRGVGVNPTRTGLLDVLQAMGGDVHLLDERDEGGEPVADILVRSSTLQATKVGGALIPRLIDELPILALAATQAQGVTRVRDAAELRVKETDRIETIVGVLRAFGAQIEPRPDGFDVLGCTPLKGATVDSHGDHRMGMTAAVAGLIAEGETAVCRAQVIADSFPGFEQCLQRIVEEESA